MKTFVFLFMPVLIIFSDMHKMARADIWISEAELAVLPMGGPYWEDLKKRALGLEPPVYLNNNPDISDINQDNDVLVLAKALVYARCMAEPPPEIILVDGFETPECSTFDVNSLRTQVIEDLFRVMNTEEQGDTLGLGRALAAYVIAADLVKLPADRDAEFRNWLALVRYKEIDLLSPDPHTLIEAHDLRPNNWGLAAGASRIAIALYLNDTIDLERAAIVFEGWLGNRDKYSDFKYLKLNQIDGKNNEWHCDPDNPVGINSKGCMREGHSIDGVLPDDIRRYNADYPQFIWPPPKENYVYTALEGAMIQAVLLHRAGYAAFEWQDQALLRAYQWLYDQAQYPPEGDDTWQPSLVDYYYGTSFWNGTVPRYGKMIGWTAWTHGKRGGGMSSNLKTNH